VRYKTPLQEYAAEMRPELGLALLRAMLKEEKELLPAVLTRNDVRLCSQTGKTERNRLIVRLFYSTGVRREEMASFVVGDIRWDDGLMFVREGKGSKDRLVCVDPKTLELLRAYTRKMALKQSLFDLTGERLNDIVEESGNMLGLVERYLAMGRRFSSHALRHSMATHSYENGMDLLALKKLLGHDHLETTEIYVQVSMARVQQEYKKAHLFNQADEDAGPTMKLRLGTQAEPDMADVIQSYRECHEWALQARTIT
jgi:integrase/recombinase XerD